MRYAATGVGLVGLLALVGCAAGPGGFDEGSRADRVIKGAPESWEGPDPDLLDLRPVVGWVSDTEFGVITLGSSSCPAVAGELQVIADDALAIEFTESPHDPCTADLSPTTHVFEPPSSVDGRPITVTVIFSQSDTEFVLELP
jgi:hypothetical protein